VEAIARDGADRRRARRRRRKRELGVPTAPRWTPRGGGHKSLGKTIVRTDSPASPRARISVRSAPFCSRAERRSRIARSSAEAAQGLAVPRAARPAVQRPSGARPWNSSKASRCTGLVSIAGVGAGANDSNGAEPQLPPG
jgi:hypothetical protein